jgi:feruloyl esterase
VFAQTPSADSCASLARQPLPGTKITTAEAISTGSFTPPGSTNVISNLPPFCRVAGVIAPTPQSQIVFEVWLPLDTWNGKFAGVGNGGWAGIISFGPLAEQLRRGYATASTNTGHEVSPGTNAAKFAFDKPEQLIDFAYRAHHETAMQAKALVQAFYSKPAERSYFIGCSSGGVRGADVGATLPHRLRRHRRRNAGEQLDTIDGGRLRRDARRLHGCGKPADAIRTGRALSRGARSL